MESPSDIAAALESVAGFLDRTEGFGEELTARAERIARRARAAAARTAEGVDDLLVVIAGPTGGGKSSILNALAGSDVTRTGVLRPTTSKPVVWTAPRRADRYRQAGVAGITRVEVVRGDHPLTEHLTFIDAPDPDSIEASHAAALAALVSVADLVVVVTSPIRYGDAVPWDVLGRVQRLGSMGWVVMNRVRDDRSGRLQTGHLVARAKAAGFDVEADQVLRVPERPSASVLPDDVSDLADVLAEVGREDAALVAAHARLLSATDVASEARGWLDDAEDVAVGAGRRSRTATAASSAERRTLADELASDLPGRSAHGPVTLRLRAGADPEEVLERLVEAAASDLGDRFGLRSEDARRLVEEASASAGSSGEQVSTLLGVAEAGAVDEYCLRLAGGLVAESVGPPPVVPPGLEGAIEHLRRLTTRPVPR